MSACEDLVRCAICLEKLSQPRALVCLHRFCLHCLQNCHQIQQVRDVIPCPLCRTPTPLPTGDLTTLRHDFYAIWTIEVVARLEQKIKELENERRETCIMSSYTMPLPSAPSDKDLEESCTVRPASLPMMEQQVTENYRVLPSAPPDMELEESERHTDRNVTDVRPLSDDIGLRHLAEKRARRRAKEGVWYSGHFSTHR